MLDCLLISKTISRRKKMKLRNLLIIHGWQPGNSVKLLWNILTSLLTGGNINLMLNNKMTLQHVKICTNYISEVLRNQPKKKNTRLFYDGGRPLEN